MARLHGLRRRFGNAQLLGVLVPLLVACGGGEQSPAAGSAGTAGAQHDSSGEGGASQQGGSQQGGSQQGGSGGDAVGGSATGGSATGGSATGGSGGLPSLAFDPSDLQLNDVSVLFPLPKPAAKGGSGLLGLADKGPRGVLLPEKLYDSVGHIVGSAPSTHGIGGDPDAPYANLRVVALRVDPCFANLTPPPDGKDCQNQLRLVVQEPGEDGAFDSALHLFYAISRDEVFQLVSSIGGLRQMVAPGKHLGKLQVHPLMVEQGLEGAMASGVRAAITAHAGEQNLIRITRMSSQGGPFWNFRGFDVTAGALTPMHIPTLPSGGDTTQLFERNFGDIGAVLVKATPPSGSPDDFMALLNIASGQALGQVDKTAKLASLLRVENPSRHSPNTVDCVTCHVATPATKLVVEPTLGLSVKGVPERFLPDPKVVPESDLEPTFADREPLTNVHAFSYGPTGVGINQRTVNESAAVVEYLSKQTFPKRD